MGFQKPKGTEDSLPADFSLRNHIFSQLRKTSESFGYKEVSTPAFEQLSLLTKKGGDEIKEQIFTLEKRSKEEFGLRFDLTVPITRLLMEHQKTLSKPVKWFSIDRMWRYEQPQKGRLREFYQLSVELFGAKGSLSDAEMIRLLLSCLQSLGLTAHDIELRLNSRELLQSLLGEYVTEKQMDTVLRLIDKRSKVGEKVFIELLDKENISHSKDINNLLNTSFEDLQPKNKMGKDALGDLQQTMAYLNDLKDFIRIDLSTARGLAYYTGIVFEVFDRGGKFRAIAGGGRYDNLVELFGGQATPATGFGLGYATLLLLLKDRNLLPEVSPGVDYFVAAFSDDQIEAALKLSVQLRKKHTVELDLMSRNVSNQMKYANKVGARNVIIVGDKEVSSGTYKVKDMKTGKESTLRR